MSTPADAEAAESIDGQYRDRPALRPVLDAVLAALPGLGPVTLALGAIDPGLVEDALRPGHVLVARIRLTRTGTLKGPSITWSAEPAG